MIQIEGLKNGKDIIYEDSRDIVKFSIAEGQIKKTITYKIDMDDKNGRPVKAGDVVEITGEEAMAELIRDREFLSYFKVEENKKFVAEKDENKEFLTGIQPLLEGKDLVYEDSRDIVKFSIVNGQIQKTVTYKKDCFNNSGIPMKEGDIVEITGEDAIIALIKDREFLSHLKVEEPGKEAGMEENSTDEIMPIDEQKFAQIYGKAKGKIKDIYSKIKSFFNKKTNDKNDKTNEENMK